MVKKLIPDPPHPPPLSDTFESRLAHILDLLRWANATAYECGDHLHGAPLDLAMASAHMIGQAQEVIGHLLDHLPLAANDESMEAPGDD